MCLVLIPVATESVPGPTAPGGSWGDGAAPLPGGAWRRAALMGSLCKLPRQPARGWDCTHRVCHAQIGRYRPRSHTGTACMRPASVRRVWHRSRLVSLHGLHTSSTNTSCTTPGLADHTLNSRLHSRLGLVPLKMPYMAYVGQQEEKN